MADMLDLFFAENVELEENVKFVASKRFKDKKGNPIEWEIKALSADENDAIKKQCITRKQVPGKRGQFTNEFDNIRSSYIKYANILPNDNNVNFEKEDMKVISKWKYAKLGLTKQGITLFSSSCDMNNYTVFPQEFQEQYLYTYILALYTKIYLKKINLEFIHSTNIKKARKQFIKFTQTLWINEVTNEDTGSLFNQYLKDVLELKTMYLDAKNKYDILYKELNIEKSAKNNMFIVILLVVAILINIINIFF